MKKTPLFLLLALLLLALAGQAQSSRQQRTFEGAIVAGFNLAQIDGDLLYGFNLPGLNLGGRVNAILSPNWQVGLELLYSQQGASRSNKDNPASPFDKIRLNYVEAPVLLHFTEWKFQLSAGLSYGRLINYNIIDFTGADVTDLYELKENNLSIVLGGTFFFRENFGLNIFWSRTLNNFRAGGLSGPGSAADTGRFFGRMLTFRGMYVF
jgi:hypothetical protein